MMKQFNTFSLVILAAIRLSTVANGAYLERENDDVERVPPLPPPKRASSLTGLIRHVAIGEPYSYGGLTVYPLRLSSGGRRLDVLAMDAALRRDLLFVRESDSASVPRIRVRNDAGRPVFLMAGEIILGGKQNRIIRNDTLLPSRSRFTEIEVYCAERDRWSGRRIEFESGGTLIAPRLRSMAAKSSAQDRIWSEIDTQLESAGVSSSTRNYQRMYEDPDSARRLDRYVVEFRPIRRRSTLGCVFLSRWRVVGCDLFCDPELFDKLWDKICRSYALDVIGRGNGEHEPFRRRHPPVGREAVRRFLDRAMSARQAIRHTPGIGRMFELSDGVTGSALIWRDGVVHASLFPEIVPLIRK